MLNKIMILIFTVVLGNVILFLYQGDEIMDFVPLVGSLEANRLCAYDFFVLVLGLNLMLLFQSFGIQPKAVIRNMQGYYRPRNAMDAVLFVSAGVITHCSLFPVILEIFSSPLDVLCSADEAIRNTVIVCIPGIWLLVVGVMTRRTTIQQPQAQLPAQQFNQNQNLPAPPAW